MDAAKIARQFSGRAATIALPLLAQGVPLPPHGSHIPGSRRANRTDPPAQERKGLLPDGFFATFAFSPRALRLVWTTAPGLTIALSLLTLAAGLLPAGIAYIGKWMIDAVVAASRDHGTAETTKALGYVALEGLAVALLLASQRGIAICQALLRARLGNRINVMILEKALEMSLPQFEDSEFYDRLTRARREASVRPLGLVMRVFGLVQQSISLAGFCLILLGFSPWAVVLLVLAGVPAFVAEAKFSGEAFRLFSWRSPEFRQQAYLEVVLAREDFAKEVKLFDLGPLLLGRYRAIFDTLFDEDRLLTWRRNLWGLGLGLVGAVALYGAFAWTVTSTIAGALTLGGMSMLLMVFKQGQSAVSASLQAVGGMYEDNLYLSLLYEFLDHRTPRPSGTATQGPLPGDGVRFEGVSFTYPDTDLPALVDIDLQLRQGETLALVGANGSGKTTLIKLLTRLYEPTGGRVLLDGLDLREWDVDALRRRIGVIFQDFARYQLPVGENIGAGDVQRFDDEAGWREAADKGMAADFVQALPNGYRTQLGKWFRDGRELSGGQWQRVALARAFMRQSAEILVLDEPTSAMDAEAESQIFDRLHELSEGRMAVLISHRFSTVRRADRIVVLEGGRILERGSHAELLAENGVYARLFQIQARGYR